MQPVMNDRERMVGSSAASRRQPESIDLVRRGFPVELAVAKMVKMVAQLGGYVNRKLG
jgi:hypothetical protein